MPAEYARRRRQLLEMLDENAALLLGAAPRRWRSSDAAWPYRQDSDLWYLTGFNEPEAVLALLPGRRHGEAVLFCREREPAYERWHGESVGTVRAVEDYRLDDAFPIDDIDDILPGMLEDRSHIYCHLGKEREFDAHLLGWFRKLRASRGGGVAPKEFLPLGHLLHELRLYKSPVELDLLREAAKVTAQAHRAAMRLALAGRREYQVMAELQRVMLDQGAEPAFTPIVAAGAAACVLHYPGREGMLRDGELLLIDAGAEIQGYAADISRTFPVNGRYTPTQRALYQLVLAAQEAAIEQVWPGRPWEAMHQAAVETLTAGLVELGLLQGQPEALIEQGEYRRFFPSKTGHWLGLDVHDVGAYRIGEDSRLLEPGMVLTVEPGLYIPPDASDVPVQWRGLGIRIEDDVAVTNAAPEVLSAELPKRVDEIEALLAER